jgi:hypothetical protein
MKQSSSYHLVEVLAQDLLPQVTLMGHPGVDYGNIMCVGYFLALRFFVLWVIPQNGMPIENCISLLILGLS